MSSNKILRIAAKFIILAAGSYSIYALYIMKNASSYIVLIAVLSATAAYIFDLKSSKSILQQVDYNSEKAYRKLKRDILYFFIFVFCMIVFGVVIYLMDKA